MQTLLMSQVVLKIFSFLNYSIFCWLCSNHNVFPVTLVARDYLIIVHRILFTVLD